MAAHPAEVQTALEEFLPAGEVWKVGPPEKASVSVQAKGLFNLLSVAYRRMGQPEYVTLLWHPGKRQIAIKPAEAGDPDAIQVRVSPGAKLVTAKRFLTPIGVDTRTALFFDDVQVVGDTLILDLDRAQPSGPVRGRRRQLLPAH